MIKPLLSIKADRESVTWKRYQLPTFRLVRN